jgi:hypothetical protein
LQDSAKYLAKGLWRLRRIADEVHCFIYGLTDEW